MKETITSPEGLSYEVEHVVDHVAGVMRMKVTPLFFLAPTPEGDIAFFIQEKPKDKSP